jgi:hypothetical protein
MLNVGYLIVMVVKTLSSSCCCVNYRCFRMIKWTFHSLASIPRNVRFEIILFVVVMGVNHVVGTSTSN